MVKSSSETATRPVAVVAGHVAIMFQVIVLAVMAWPLATADASTHAGAEIILTGHIVVAIALVALSVGLVRRSNAARCAVIGLEALVVTAQVFLLLGGASGVGYVDVILSIVVLASLGMDESRDWFEGR